MAHWILLGSLNTSRCLLTTPLSQGACLSCEKQPKKHFLLTSFNNFKSF